MRHVGHRSFRLAIAIALAGLATPASAASGAPEAAPSPDIRSYCTNVAAAATDARFAWQTTRLKDLETHIEQRIKDLDAKTAELKGWIERREMLEKLAGEKLVGIYAKMRPETAATQIGSLPDEMAAAVLGQMGPRQASAIFNEIPAERAGKLAGMIAGAQPATDDKKL